MIILTSAEKTKLEAVAARLGVPPQWLYVVIDRESGWRPQVKNPGSSARGLIQFMDATARELGYSGSADLIARHPDIVSQLDVVEKYLRRFKPFPSLQSLALAIFYPAYRHRPALDSFPDSVQRANPGIRTIQDYMRPVYKRLQLLDGAKMFVPIGAALLLLFFIISPR